MESINIFHVEHRAGRIDAAAGEAVPWSESEEGFD
jgi:hypothetical protein